MAIRGRNDIVQQCEEFYIAKGHNPENSKESCRRKDQVELHLEICPMRDIFERLIGIITLV